MMGSCISLSDPCSTALGLRSKHVNSTPVWSLMPPHPPSAVSVVTGFSNQILETSLFTSWYILVHRPCFCFVFYSNNQQVSQAFWEAWSIPSSCLEPWVLGRLPDTAGLPAVPRAASALGPLVRIESRIFFLNLFGPCVLVTAQTRTTIGKTNELLSFFHKLIHSSIYFTDKKSKT